MFDQFKQHRRKRIRVHDRNLTRWGMEKGRELDMDFRASHHWLLNFKHRHKIVSRKITRQLSRKNAAEEVAVSNNAQDFINKIKPIFASDPSRVFNSDQTGFKIELYSERTLEVQGTRHVEALVVAQHSLTHSYTVMPLISGDGRLIKPTLIVHKTPEGVFGKRVLQSMFTHDSILVRTTTSGKVTKEILKEWATEILFKADGTNGCTLLLDSFSLHKDIANFNANKPRGFKYSIEYIPPGTTSKCQPLDKEPNRTLKQMIRIMSEAFLIIDDRITDRIRLSSRDAIDIMQVLLLNQFDSPRFNTWIAHAWKSCGYTSDQILCTSPTKFCFDMNVYRTKCSLCDRQSNHSAFIRCGWCKLYLCEFHYFFCDEIHFCLNYVE